MNHEKALSPAPSSNGAGMEVALSLDHEKKIKSTTGCSGLLLRLLGAGCEAGCRLAAKLTAEQAVDVAVDLVGPAVRCTTHKGLKTAWCANRPKPGARSAFPAKLSAGTGKLGVPD